MENSVFQSFVFDFHSGELGLAWHILLVWMGYMSFFVLVLPVKRTGSCNIYIIAPLQRDWKCIFLQAKFSCMVLWLTRQPFQNNVLLNTTIKFCDLTYLISSYSLHLKRWLWTQLHMHWKKSLVLRAQCYHLVVTFIEFNTPSCRHCRVLNQLRLHLCHFTNCFVLVC